MSLKPEELDKLKRFRGEVFTSSEIEIPPNRLTKLAEMGVVEVVGERDGSKLYRVKRAFLWPALA